MGFMQTEGYQGWGQEGEEICMTTWYKGGRVVVNKNTWYAHLHKGKTYGRMYSMSQSERVRGNAYSFDFWWNNRWVERAHDIEWLIDRFWPHPGWPENWKELKNET